MPLFLGYYWRGEDMIERNGVFDGIDPFTFWYYDFKYELMVYQQQPFFFSGFLLFNLLVLTSTGIKLDMQRFTFLQFCFKLKPKRSAQRLPKLPVYSWRWLSSVWSLGALPEIPEHLSLRLLVLLLCRFCCLPGWRGTFLVLWERLDSETRWSKIRCYQRTV